MTSTVSSCCQPKASPCCEPVPSSCCAPARKPSLSHYEKFMEIAMKISVIVLSIVSAYISPQTFVPSFLLGVGLGVWQNWNNRSTEHSKKPGTFCTQGFFEQATGVKLPDIVNLVANVGLTYVHIEHHSDIYTMLSGLYSGSWLGSLIAPSARDCYSRFEQGATLAYRNIGKLCFPKHLKIAI